MLFLPKKDINLYASLKNQKCFADTAADELSLRHFTIILGLVAEANSSHRQG